MPAYRCTVTQAGPNHEGDVLIWLVNKEGGEPNGWYKAVNSVKREMLATALYAMSTGASVEAHLESATVGSMIMQLYSGRP
jgi:hypothetical protein